MSALRQPDPHLREEGTRLIQRATRVAASLVALGTIALTAAVSKAVPGRVLGSPSPSRQPAQAGVAPSTASLPQASSGVPVATSGGS